MERLAEKHIEVFVEQAGRSDDLTQSADALGSPSYNQLQSTAGQPRLCELVEQILAMVR